MARNRSERARYQASQQRAQQQAAVAASAAQAKATATTSPSPAPEAGGGPPPDPALEAQKAQARTALGLGSIWDTYQTGTVNADFGFNTAGAIDPNNPYSRASLLQRSYEQNRQGTSNSMAAAGLRGDGVYQSAQAANARQYDIGLDQLRKQRDTSLNEIRKGTVDRYSMYGGQLDQATLDSLIRALGG